MSSCSRFKLELSYPSLAIKTVEDYYSYLNNSKLPEEQEYCYYEYMDSSREVYEAIADICYRHGIREVHDIGCCYAMQALMFAGKNIVYMGVEVAAYMKPYVPKGRNIFYRFVKYPDRRIRPFTSSWHAAAISSLCIGYQCRGEEVWRCMANNYEYFVGVIPESEHPAMEKYYEVKKIYPLTKYTEILFCRRKCSR